MQLTCQLERPERAAPFKGLRVAGQAGGGGVAVGVYDAGPRQNEGDEPHIPGGRQPTRGGLVSFLVWWWWEWWERWEWRVRW